jgi:CHAT domain-containing protein
MKQRGLGLGLSIGLLLLTGIKTTIPETAKTSAYSLALENEELTEAERLNQQVVQLHNQGEYKKAIFLAKYVLATRKKILSKDHLDIAQSLNNLGALYVSNGKYKQVEPLYQRALIILKKNLGKDHPDVATNLNNLAELYRNQGKYVQAEPLYKQALAIRERALGKNHPSVATSLNNLAALHDSRGKYVQAEPLYKQALAIFLKNLSKGHPDIASSMNNLASLYDSQGKYVQSEPFYQQSLFIREKTLGKYHPDVAQSLDGLASLYDRQGKQTEAELLYQRALAIRQKALSKEHPEVVISLNNLASLYENQGEYAQAVKFHNQASVITEQQLSKMLFVGSERDKKDYINNVLVSPNFSVNLAIKSNILDAPKLATANVLRRQGRILDATATTIQNIRTQLKNRPDLQKIFDNLKSIFQEQSALSTSKLSEKNHQIYKARYQELEQRRQELESKLSAESAIFRQATAPVELARVQSLIPQDAALVHIVRYLPHNSNEGATNRFGSPRYAAATLRTTSNPHWIDLGTYLQDGSNTSNRQRQQLARTLHTQLIQPLRQHLGDAKHLLLSPDAALNLIPFEALQDTDNKYLIEQYTFSYLTSGRDLLRFPAAPPSRQAPVVFSEIDYQDNFSPLATQAETNQIQTIFPNAQIIRDRAATKTALQQVQAPQILHLATHGFFKPVPKDTTANLDNPLTRSGIVLAGANSRSGAGILTGLEASALDLYGTQLVVLSACETSLGDISAGEGIYGLRRALVIAGSQSQVLSLWKVGDAATVELMKLFYQNLKAGMGRHQALRDAQLKLLQHPNYQNPHNWAAFIPSGNWEPLSKASH